VRGPPITVKCDCGQVQYVAYGEAWQCPDCGRRWNTAQIPSEEYWGIMREMRRYRLQAIAAALLIGAGFAALAATTGPRALAVAPIVMGGWFFFFMPRWRRKVRARARSLPRWQLHPE
jgi:hypothetical protein